MARITVQDCLERIPNRFELVMIAAKRARQLEREGAKSTIPEDGDRSTVIALREIAVGNVTAKILEDESTSSQIKKTVQYSDYPVSGETGEVV